MLLAATESNCWAMKYRRGLFRLFRLSWWVRVFAEIFHNQCALSIACRKLICRRNVPSLHSWAAYENLIAPNSNGKIQLSNRCVFILSHVLSYDNFILHNVVKIVCRMSFFLLESLNTFLSLLKYWLDATNTSVCSKIKKSNNVFTVHAVTNKMLQRPATMLTLNTLRWTFQHSRWKH